MSLLEFKKTTMLFAEYVYHKDFALFVILTFLFVSESRRSNFPPNILVIAVAGFVIYGKICALFTHHLWQRAGRTSGDVGTLGQNKVDQFF